MVRSPENIQGKYRLFVVGAIGTFMATLDGSILNVALPSVSVQGNRAIDVDSVASTEDGQS